MKGILRVPRPQRRKPGQHPHSIHRSAALAALALGLFSSNLSARPFLDAADFGLRELPPGADATPVFRRAVEACQKRNARGLRIPAGEWHLHPDHAFQQTLPVANNDPGIKRVVFALDRLRDFTFDATGAQFVCHGEMIPISAENTRGLTLRGFTLDWQQPFTFEGRVVAVHPELNAFDLEVHPEAIYELRGSRLVFMGKPPHAPNAWKDWAPPTTEYLTWQRNLQWNVWVELPWNRPLPGEFLWALEPDPRVEEVRPRVVRIFDALKHLPTTNMVLVVNGMMEPNRTSPAIRVSHCTRLLIEDVTLHHAGGMGLIVQRTEDAVVRRLQVILPPGKNRHVTTPADATHFNGCRGTIVIEDSTFENMLDDFTNVHGCFVRVERQIGPRTLLLRRMHGMQRGLMVADRGDRVRFVSSADLQPYCEARVTGTRELNWDLFEMTVDRLPPGGVQPDSGLYNLTWQPDLVVRGCTVRTSRGRTMLIATGGDVLVENNRFSYSSMAGIQFEADNHFWWESGPTRNVVIRSNLFHDIYGPVLSVVPSIDAERFPDALYHGGIIFENNTIQTFHRVIATGVAVDGLVFRGNTITPTDTFGNTDVTSPSFLWHSGRNIVMEDNTFTGQPPLRVKAGTAAARPQLHRNRGIEMARPPSSDEDLRFWLENMIVHHDFTTEEVTTATGLGADEIANALKRFGLKPGNPPSRSAGDPLWVLPYPGGRHPRIGFLDGAVDPQRETKVSVFTPWEPRDYVVVDVPEAIFSDLGLTYLAHTHIPTLWDQQGLTLPPMEWRREADGVLVMERTLPNRIAFGTRVIPRPDGVLFEQWLRNGTSNTLTALRVQNCVMLKMADGFNHQTNQHTVFQPPYAAIKARDRNRWIITGFEPFHRPWANPPVPCLHADPRFPDCAPGKTTRIRGWLSFYEGDDIHAELQRLDTLGWRLNPIPSRPPQP